MQPVNINRYVRGESVFELVQPGFLKRGYARLVARKLPNPIYRILQEVQAAPLNICLNYE